jgi:hypothetical protein
LEVDFKKLTQEDWDKVLIITGDEGTGKSNLALHIMDWWLTKLYGKVTEEDINKIGLTSESFVTTLQNAKRYEPTVYDESGELSNKRSMSNFNVSITQAYQVIRGLNLLTVLVLPSIFDLEGFFTKRRARGLIYVFGRTKESSRFAYWDKARMRNLVSMNQYYYIKNIWAVPPTFRSSFTAYKGVLKSSYDSLKNKKILDTQKQLYDKFHKKPPVKIDKNVDAIIRLSEKEGQRYTAEIFGIAQSRVSTIVRANKKQT